LLYSVDLTGVFTEHTPAPYVGEFEHVNFVWVHRSTWPLVHLDHLKVKPGWTLRVNMLSTAE